MVTKQLSTNDRWPVVQPVRSDPQVKSKGELVVGEFYRQVNSGSGYEMTFRLVGIDTHVDTGPFPFFDEGWIVVEVVKERRTDYHPVRRKGTLINLSLRDMAVIPYHNGEWNPFNWLERAPKQIEKQAAARQTARPIEE